MTTKQSHLNFVASVRVDLVVLVNRLENVRSRRSVRKLKLVECFLIHSQFVSPVEVFYRNIVQNHIDFVVSVLIHQMRLHVLLYQLLQKLFKLWCFCRLLPFFTINVGICQPRRQSA